MAAHPQALAPPPALDTPRRQDSISAWPLVDRLCYGLCWAAGIGLCVVTAAIVLFMFVKGISYLRPSLFVQAPTGSLDQSQAGGLLDPIEGTLLLTALGVAIAAPMGVAIAAWLSEYHRPEWLARAVESGVEMIAGAPSVVLAIFGLLVFSQGFLGFLSQRSAGGAVYGRSFVAAGVIMSLLAIPLIVASTREGLAQLPAQLREASYALGKTKSTTIRRVLLPSVRPNIASGIALGMGRIIGDTAIVVILLGATLRLEGAGGLPVLSTLRGTGSTLTAYVYQNSPAGEGNAAQKAYAAAFVLLMLVLALNFLVTRLSSERSGWGVTPALPPPVRRIAVDGAPTVAEPKPAAPGAPAPEETAPAGSIAARRAARPPVAQTVERMHIESVWLAYGERWVVRDVTLPVRQGEVLALIGASGSGKTTLLRSLNRLTEVTASASRAGRITLDGQEIGEMEATDLRRRVSMVFQQPNPFPMSIFENVAYALREERSADRSWRRAGRRDLRPQVIEALRSAGLYEEVADDLDHPALRLSGGQQQRLCIARALAAGPEVLLLDEPCSALDPISTATIEELIVSLRDRVAIVIVTHNLQQAFRVADHVAFMHLGELVEYGPSEQVFDHPLQQRTRDYISGAFG